jgi:hypothetical protein
MTNLIKGTKAADANQSVILFKDNFASKAFYGKVVSKTAARTIVEVEVSFGTVRAYFTSRKGFEHYGHQFSKTTQYNKDTKFESDCNWKFDMYEDSEKTEALVNAYAERVEASRLAELARLKETAQNKLLELMAKTEGASVSDLQRLLRGLNSI